ncbi:DUF6678 family protein [Dyella silvatica]|uniref:DUF6678 family protein n=1 Tax=Dyella silvatica TaxID=2992128 RepID=UPI00224DE176|nr:DUF6678 family protein [Dyella silvatica]
MSRKLIESIKTRGLAGAANDTKWNELIDFIRSRDGWVPSYRCKFVLNGYISRWDTEWSYHLPFPFKSVEWFDIGLHQLIRHGPLLPVSVIDHSEWLLPKIHSIGFDHVVAGDVVRLFGYLPRDMGDLPAS